ncbi:MAG TPA: carboxypeptidase regulatory-like domain-containing protein [Pyrinomonadaceae bacterium]|jgi:hypothetical protein
MRKFEMGNVRSLMRFSCRQKTAIHRGLLFFLSFVLCLPTVMPGQDFLAPKEVEAVEALLATQNDLVGPAGTERFGAMTVVLPNGNLVVTDPFYDITVPFPVEDAGAVFLYNGGSGALISALTGDEHSDQVGSGGVTLLANGKFVVSSPNWSNFRGAATVCSPISGCGSIITAGNSLIGSAPGDNVSNYGVKALTNGDYVVRSANWNGGRGAATFGSAASGATGAISGSNSLVGTVSGDAVGDADVIALANGNYVVLSGNWNGVGAATFGNSATDGAIGTVSSANSLVGSSTGDFENVRVTILTNDNYVVINSRWDNIPMSAPDAGAATWGSKTGGVSGVISSSNSVVGSQANDQVGGSPGVVPLINGNYVVGSSDWNNQTGAATWGDGITGSSGIVSDTNSLVGTNISVQLGGISNSGGIYPLTNGNYVVSCPVCSVNFQDNGAVTWGNGSTGTSGVVSAANSLYGANEFDSIGRGVLALPNGNYVVTSEYWNEARGAVTMVNGAAAASAAVGAGNSLTGANPNDLVGSGKTLLLTNGNYVVFSPGWNNNSGAVTWMNGLAAVSGTVSAANSLVGTSAGDRIGSDYGAALTNGNYVIQSPNWSGGRGAATWRDGSTLTSGTISAANSLIGNSSGDNVGQKVVPLANNNYVVVSPNVRNGTVLRVGAVTWSDGAGGTNGTVSPGNSLIGTTVDDNVGNAGVVALPNGNYVVTSTNWDRASIKNAGAITYGAGNAATTFGAITVNNSARGSSASGGASLNYAFDSVNDRLVVARPNDNRVTLFRPSATAIINGNSNNGATWDYGTIIQATDVVVPSPLVVTLANNTPVRDVTVRIGGTLSVSGNNAISGTVNVSGTLDLSGGKLDVGNNIVIINCGGSIAGASAAHYIQGSLQQCVNSSSFNFPVGTANGYSPVQLSNVIGGGNFTVKAVQSQYPQTIGLPSGRLQRYWTLTNNGLSQADVTFNYLEKDAAGGTESNYRVYKIANGEASPRTTSLNTTTNTATAAGVTSFSDWTLADGETVTPFAIKGQITVAGNPLPGATVALSGSSNNFIQTDASGYYSFTVNSGGDYTVTPSLTNYTFAPADLTFENLKESKLADFTATPAYNLSGAVSYGTTPANQPQKFVSGVSLTAALGVSSVSTATGPSGAYLLENLTSGGPYTITLSKTGNVNGISPSDATMILRHIAANGQGPNALNANQRIAADASGDGNITPFDATQILRYIAAGAPNANTGQVGNWRFSPPTRDYEPLVNSLAGQDYEAILVGEVNGNWTPPAPDSIPTVENRTKIAATREKAAQKR